MKTASKAALLVALTLHTSASSFLLHTIKATSGAGTVAKIIVISEVFKLAISVYALLYLDDHRCSVILPSPATSSKFYANANAKYKDAPRVINILFDRQAAKLVVPAALYVMQNNLRLFAAARMEPVYFQTIGELKTVATAMASTLLLGRLLSRRQWSAIFVLTIGVMAVQLSTISSVTGYSPIGIMVTLELQFAIASMICACILSGVAGVYLEHVFALNSFWKISAQLSFYSTFIALLPFLFTLRDGTSSVERLSSGFSWQVWCAIAVQTSGGFLVASVIKHIGSVQKNFAQGLSLVVSALICAMLLRQRFSATFLGGTVAVLAATYFYNTVPDKVQNKLCTVQVDGKGDSFVQNKLDGVIRKPLRVALPPIEEEDDV